MKRLQPFLSERQIALLLVITQGVIDNERPNFDNLTFYTNNTELPTKEELQDITDELNDKLIGN